MYEYIKGELVEATPANAIVDCGGVRYYIHISVNTYSKIASQNQVMLYIHQIVREDAHWLYGFFSKEERSLFRALISVSGIGANTANGMLSSMSVEEITGAILTENVNAIKSVKGIGLKTAQRIIVDLRDKILSLGMATEEKSDAAAAVVNVEVRDEAVAALTMLGFSPAPSAKVVVTILEEHPGMPDEQVVKQAKKQIK